MALMADLRTTRRPLVSGVPEAVEPSCVSVVIPARNEAVSIGRVVAELRRAQPSLSEILVIDDGSTDGTGEAAEAAGATVIRHPRSRGYGSSLKSGIAAAGGEFILTVDGDGQHGAGDVHALLQQARPYDLVTGHRTRRHHTTIWRLPGKWLLTRFCRYLVRQPIPDLNCGLRVYRRRTIARYARLCSDGYSFTATSLVLLRLATLVDPLRVFLPVSGIAAVAGIAWGVPYAAHGRGISVGALLLLLTALLLFAVGLLSDQIAQMRKEQLDR